uniref:DNA helicase/primase complex-associated protein n=1 Tax=Lygus hesperus TaxID=30085 RepID=A0A0A9YW09_LYGHE
MENIILGHRKKPKDCSPSLVPRPTGFCKRYARNIPADRINPDQKTGVRRKVLLPPLASQDGSDIDDEVEEDFRQAEADCMDEFYGTRSPSAMPWTRKNLQAADDDDPATALSKLIEQENEEMETSKMYLEKAMYEESKFPKTYRELTDAYKSRYNHDESLLDSELQPELAAQLLQSEEHGANLKHIPPAALYGRLFPDDRSIPKIMVTAASKRRRGVVIPVRAGLQQDDQLLDDLDAGIVDYYEINAFNKPKDSKPMPSPIKHEAEGDADQILGLASESNEMDDERKPFKYIVTHEPPLHGNYAQLRGSEPPIWFPGFFTINPGVPELQAIDEPNEALEKAWENMNPSQISSPYGNILLGK